MIFVYKYSNTYFRRIVMVFGVYCRKSVLSDKGESVENQINICRSYILSRFGEDNVIIPYEDEGYSGKNTARPMFLKMIY